MLVHFIAVVCCTECVTDRWNTNIAIVYLKQIAVKSISTDHAIGWLIIDY